MLLAPRLWNRLVEATGATAYFSLVPTLAIFLQPNRAVVLVAAVQLVASLFPIVHLDREHK